jgi:hypothetical protein
MGIIDDILTALDRIPAWKRLQELPGEIDALKARMAFLEEKLGTKWPPDICRHCGERGLRLVGTSPSGKEHIREDWKCEKCGQYEIKLVKPIVR